MLTASFVSTVIGTQLPGPGCVYLSQNLRFRAPVKIGDSVVTHVTIKDMVREKSRVVLETICRVGDRVVLDGEAVLLVDSRPAG